MPGELSVTVVFHWERMDPDYNVQCRGCGEQVFGPFYQLHGHLCDEPMHEIKGWRICESCHHEITNRTV